MIITQFTLPETLYLNLNKPEFYNNFYIPIFYSDNHHHHHHFNFCLGKIISNVLKVLNSNNNYVVDVHCSIYISSNSSSGNILVKKIYELQLALMDVYVFLSYLMDKKYPPNVVQSKTNENTTILQDTLFVKTQFLLTDMSNNNKNIQLTNIYMYGCYNK